MSSLPSGLFLPAFPPKPSYPHACYMPCPSHPTWLDHSNYIWHRVQAMKLLIMHVSPAPYYFLCLQSKYSPQQPVLKYLQSIFFS
jgi:hypothetical protein